MIPIDQQAAPHRLDISVIICTRNRAESLRETLECLARADRGDLHVDVVVVDNGSADGTRAVAESFQGRLPVRYLFEPTLGTYGKSHALNRAVSEGGLGDIVAVLDDDMSPDRDWFQAVSATCRRWPQADIFGGRIYVIWPDVDIPGWARVDRLLGGFFSAVEPGPEDRPFPAVGIVSGNHFWFRASALEGGRRFRDMWLTEPDFALGLMEEGSTLMWTSTAAAGHRIQPALLDRGTMRGRAITLGRANGEMRLAPHRRSVSALQFRQHPVVHRLRCGGRLLFWCSRHARAHLRRDPDLRFADSLHTLERLTMYREILRRANQYDEFAISSSRRRRAPAALPSR